MASDHDSLASLLAPHLDATALVGITLEQQGRNLLIRFSHPYLSAYWQNNYREQVEAAARLELGHDLAFVYDIDPSGLVIQKPERMRTLETDPFGNFIGSAKNDLALNAARQICQRQLHGLLVIGSAGTGKSHLLKAMTACLQRACGGTKVLYTKAEALPECAFWQQGIALLVDDVQQLTGSVGGQERLAGHLDLASSQTGVVVLTCRAESRACLCQPLQQRLDALLQVELEPADVTMRIAWLERQNLDRNLGLTGPQIFTLAQFGRHIRHLQGLLQKFEFYAKMGNRSRAWEELEKLAPPEQATPWLCVFATVSRQLNIGQEVLVGASRKREAVFARQVAMYLCRTKLGLSYSELGRIFGGRDHATVIHSIRKIEELQRVDEFVHNLLTELAANLF